MMKNAEQSCPSIQEHEKIEPVRVWVNRPPDGMGMDTWFNSLKVGDEVYTGEGRKEVVRKKYENSYMLGFDANGRTNCAQDGYYPIAIAGCSYDEGTIEYRTFGSCIPPVN